jgi:hypothetical protein
VAAAAVVAALNKAFVVAVLTVTVAAVIIKQLELFKCPSVLSAATAVVTRGWFKLLWKLQLL